MVLQNQTFDLLFYENGRNYHYKDKISLKPKIKNISFQ